MSDERRRMASQEKLLAEAFHKKIFWPRCVAIGGCGFSHKERKVHALCNALQVYDFFVSLAMVQSVLIKQPLMKGCFIVIHTCGLLWITSRSTNTG